MAGPTACSLNLRLRKLNRGRREMRSAAFGNLERLAAKAAECLEKAIDQGDVKAALEVLKRLQLFAPARIGSDDPTELAAAAERAAQIGDNQMRAMVAELAGCGPAPVIKDTPTDPSFLRR